MKLSDFLCELLFQLLVFYLEDGLGTLVQFPKLFLVGEKIPTQN